jgi:RimJ/RimL family protein N-acetyltransferase
MRAANAGPRLRTDRLLLRRWRAADLGPLAAMNADPCVMACFPATLSAGESAELIERIEACFAEHGYGLWAVEVLAAGDFVGFVGLSPVAPPLPFAPAVEIGWRLARPYWGRGLAHEAAGAAIDFAFERLGLGALVSFTAAGNRRSRRLMERLGMRRDPAEDFIHPALAKTDPLAPHVLYRLDAGPGGGSSPSPMPVQP